MEQPKAEQMPGLSAQQSRRPTDQGVGGRIAPACWGMKGEPDGPAGPDRTEPGWSCPWTCTCVVQSQRKEKVNGSKVEDFQYHRDGEFALLPGLEGTTWL